MRSVLPSWLLPSRLPPSRPPFLPLPRVRRAVDAVTAVVAAVAVAVLVLVGLPLPAAHAAEAPVPPPMHDGFGLTRTGPVTGTATNFVVTVTTPQVAGEHRIRILLPRDYTAETTRRYPVLYFLHGASDDPGNPNLAYPALTAAQSMITVIPDGGRRGWYTDWRDQDTAAGAQNWETFHISQVIPYIDANLRTLTGKQNRAVAGLSMGGFGALHYAQRHPGLFGQVASLSGATDLSANHLVMRGAVVATLTNAGAALCGSSGPTCSLDFGPTVSSDAIFGSPYPILNADRLWNEADPSSHMDRLEGMGVALYTGDGNGNPAEPEFWVRSAAQHAKDGLDRLGHPYHYVDYGNGSGWGGACDGGHNYGCWAQDLVDYVPRLEAAFASAA